MTTCTETNKMRRIDDALLTLRPSYDRLVMTQGLDGIDNFINNNTLQSITLALLKLLNNDT
ncbi:MAG: hypothetical protein CMF70_03040 [Magnetovibrio sp.]|nr:hypothetical protein [Magnetovibrio sp.]